MDTVFPFGFPWPTAFYLTLYVLTLAVHVVFMNYVFAGAGLLAVVSLAGGNEEDPCDSGMALILRDWMPFALSAAITAGIAPLLFVQILYKHQFYTANLLLFHRWMAVVPVLIVGFYLLYLLKSKVIGEWTARSRIVVGVGAFVCIAFVGYSWTENHLLSLSAGQWADFYVDGRVVYWEWGLLPRLGMWLVGSIPTMVTLVCWQLWLARRRGATIGHRRPRASDLALAGVVLSMACGLLYYLSSAAAERAAITGRLAGAYLAVAVVGVVLQVVCWLRQRRLAGLSPRLLAGATLGSLATILAMTVVREAIRLARVDITALFEDHAEAARRGGLIVFLLFATINTAVIAWICINLRRHLNAHAQARAEA